MEIVWLGHSSLLIKGNSATVVTDPYPDSLGISMGRPQADIVTISNSHPHHSSSEMVAGEPKVINGPGEYEISNFYISGMATRHHDHNGTRHINTVFTFRAEGLTLCHLGDLSDNLSPIQVDELNQTEVLFVPAGGNCTIDASKAIRFIRLIEPRIVIPIHYGMEGLNVELDPLEKLLHELGVTEYATQSRLSITSSNLPGELRVVVLQKAT